MTKKILPFQIKAPSECNVETVFSKKEYAKVVVEKFLHHQKQLGILSRILTGINK